MLQRGETGCRATPSTLPVLFASGFSLKMLEILSAFLQWDTQRVYD